MNLIKISIGDSTKGDTSKIIKKGKSIIFPFPCSSSTDCTFYSVNLPSAKYLLEVWGAQGGNDTIYPTTIFGGRGGYSRGKLTLKTAQTLHIYIGGSGTGNRGSTYGSTGGGGGTDIRLVPGSSNSETSLKSRLLVAGGGGGRNGGNRENKIFVGNDGGGSTSPTFTANGYTITGATYHSGGTSTRNDDIPGSFGFSTPNSYSNSYSVGGYNGGSRGSDNWANGGAGGGWWGGCTSWPTGSGGSGFVLNETTIPNNYPVSSNYFLTEGKTISGNTAFHDPFGNPETGHHGNGFAKITLLSSPTMRATISRTRNNHKPECSFAINRLLI